MAVDSGEIQRRQPFLYLHVRPWVWLDGTTPSQARGSTAIEIVSGIQRGGNHRADLLQPLWRHHRNMVHACLTNIDFTVDQ